MRVCDVAREHLLQETIERNTYQHLHQTLNSDIDMMDSQSQLERLQAEIAALNNQIKKHEADREKYENMELDMQLLRDEIDVLRPAAKQVELLEDQIARYRDKMDEVTPEAQRHHGGIAWICGKCLTSCLLIAVPTRRWRK